MHSDANVQQSHTHHHQHHHTSENNNNSKTQGKRVPTLCITAPDDIHQSDRDTLWTFHARNRGPSNTLEYSKLYADDSILDSNGSLVVKGHVPHRSQFSACSFPGRNFTMSDRERSDSDGGKRYKFDLPDITPKINPMRFQTNKMVIPSIKGGPPVVSKGLQPLVSYSSFGYPSDDEEDHSPSPPRGRYLATSLPATLSHTEFALSSPIVIRSLEAEREEQPMSDDSSSASDETNLGCLSDNVTDTAPTDNNINDIQVSSTNYYCGKKPVSNNNYNRKPIKKGHLENFIKVPTATTDTNLFPALEITSGIMIPDEKYKRTKEFEKNQRIIVRKRYSRPKLKSKRHSKDDAVMFTYKKLGPTSSAINNPEPTPDYHPTITDEQDSPSKKHGLRELIDNYVIQRSGSSSSDEVFRIAKNKFNDMVNTKEVLDESLYDDFARYNERPSPFRRESTLLMNTVSKTNKTEDNKGGRNTSTESSFICRSYRDPRDYTLDDTARNRIKWK